MGRIRQLLEELRRWLQVSLAQVQQPVPATRRQELRWFGDLLNLVQHSLVLCLEPGRGLHLSAGERDAPWPVPHVLPGCQRRQHQLLCRERPLLHVLRFDQRLVPLTRLDPVQRPVPHWAHDVLWRAEQKPDGQRQLGRMGRMERVQQELRRRDPHSLPQLPWRAQRRNLPWLVV